MTIESQISQQRKQLEDAVAQALELAAAQADAAEVSINKSTGISVSTRYGEVENVEFNSDGALGITVYWQQRKGCASSTDLSPTAIQRTVQAALDIARYTSPDPCSGLADKQLMAFDAPDLGLCYPKSPDVTHAIAQAAEAERYALAQSDKINHSEGGSYNSHYGTTVYGNTYGLLKSYNSSRYSLSCCVIAEHNGEMERDYAYTIARDSADLCEPQWVGEQCAQRAMARLNPRSLPTQQVPVLFAAEVATGLFGHLAGAISGGNIYRKSSFLLDALGQSILPDWLTITEDPHIIKGLASTPFDSEGVLTQKRDIVQHGVLQHYLLTAYTARKLAMQSTGHAGGIHNWLITGQPNTFAQLVQQMDRGLIVTELMGQGVNMVTGDYSRGASGFWVEHGKIQYPVSGITIAGNLRDMFRHIVTIGSDVETRSTIQCGSVLIESMMVAGE